MFTVDRELGAGYAQQWNVAVQRAITRTLSFEVAYVGSKITHIGLPDTNINQLTVERLALGRRRGYLRGLRRSKAANDFAASSF